MSKAVITELEMHLFAPGMTPLHRAGLGGLACTLRAMEHQHSEGQLDASQLPGPLRDGKLPWHITTTSVTLDFAKPELAGEYLRKLFAFAFTVGSDGLIRLPGQYREGTAPPAPLLADLHNGMMLTFLQHGKVRQLAKDATTVMYDPEGDGAAGVVVQYRQCSGFKHQNAWKDLVDNKGRLRNKPIRIDGPISPGTVVRHVAYTGDTAAEDPPERMLPLLFALAGCLTISMNRGAAALIVPEVDDLENFVENRHFMTPPDARQAQVASAADAVLQAQVRLHSRGAMRNVQVPGCYAMTFTSTAWASQQKSRVATLHVGPQSDRILDRFDRAFRHLPPRIVTRTIKESTGRGKQKSTVERKEAFRTDSVVRPLVALNLATGRPWYANFISLMVKSNPATGKPYRHQLNFERKGLAAMIKDSKMWDQESEKLLVEAVHQAIRRAMQKIRKDTDDDKPLSQATKNRWERFREKLRLDLAGAKTEEHVRFAFVDLFSRAGRTEVLQQHWPQVLTVLRQDWQLARDLGLLALASYAGKGRGAAAVAESVASESAQ